MPVDVEVSPMSERFRTRRRRTRGRAACAVVLSVAVWGCTSVDGDEADVESGTSADPIVSAVSSPRPLPPGGTGSWRSARVVDGDTLDLSSPRGDVTVRVIGINAPESGECFSEEATAALAALVADQELILVPDRSDLDQFERSLRYVETAAGVDVGAELVAGGFAIARRYPPDDARADVYADLQRTARREQRGLWAPDACGAGDIDGVEIVVDVNADAPGDDSQNLNGEWVRFTNAGSAAVELDGWEVADESASHRYRFSDLRLEPGGSVTLFSGCGPDDESVRHWCVSGSAVWNNSGDTVFLRDGRGNIVVSLSYGDSR
jgi:micrococcal nuclease